MQGAWLLAAALAVLLAAGHSYLGERYILIRLFRRSDLPKLFGSSEFTKHTLRFAWHLTSVAWVGLAGVLVELGHGGAVSRSELALVVSGTFGVSGIIALVGSRGRHLSWIVFFAISLLVWLGGQ